MSFDETKNAFELLRRIKNEGGYGAALEELRQFMGKRLYCFALNRLHDEAQAEDVVSETLVAVWGKPESYKGDSRLSVWMYGIAKNKIRTLQRKSEPSSDDIDDLADYLESSELGPFDVLSQKQYQDQIYGCLDTLSNVKKECLMLTFYDEFSTEEIAQVQQVPTGTVKTRRKSGLNDMKTCLEKAFQADAREVLQQFIQAGAHGHKLTSTSQGTSNDHL
jgi:RNA polymerase sigma-70 factor, ECF subfamily